MKEIQYGKLMKEINKTLKNLDNTIAKNIKTVGLDEKARLNIIAAKKESTKEYFENVKAMKLLSKELRGGTNDMKMFTGLITKGVGVTTIFGKLANKANDMIGSYDKLKDKQDELATMTEKFGQMKANEDGSMTIGEGWAGASDKERARGAGLAQDVQKGTKDGGMGGLGKQLSGAKEFFGKHKMGMMIGAGSAGVLIGILKKALDVSPMFQQIKKLLNFGIMMVLRPIGDFFGFLLRPIMVWMLRKLIIPFYQTYLPIAQQMGTDIGNFIVGFFDWVAQFGVIMGNTDQHITESVNAQGLLVHSAVTNADGKAITSHKELIKHIQQASNNQISAHLKTTSSINSTMGNWKKYATAIFGDQTKTETKVTGYNVGSWGKNIPLTAAARQAYEDKGIEVTPVTGSGYQDNKLGGGMQHNKRGTGGDNAVPIIQNISIWLDGEKLDAHIDNRIEETESKSGSPR